MKSYIHHHTKWMDSIFIKIYFVIIIPNFEVLMATIYYYYFFSTLFYFRIIIFFVMD